MIRTKSRKLTPPLKWYAANWWAPSEGRSSDRVDYHNQLLSLRLKQKKRGGGPRPAAVAKAHEKKTNPAPTQKATTDRPTKNDGQLPALPGPATRWWGRALGTSSSSLLKEYTQPTEPRGTRLEHHHRQPPTTGCRTHKRNEHHVLLQRGGGAGSVSIACHLVARARTPVRKRPLLFFMHPLTSQWTPSGRWPGGRLSVNCRLRPTGRHIARAPGTQLHLDGFECVWRLPVRLVVA